MTNTSRIKSTSKCIVFLFLLSTTISCNAQKKKVNSDNQSIPSKIWNTFDAGPYQIGFKTFLEIDNSRKLKDSSVRPLQISFWYPTKKASAEKMTLKDYFLLSETELELNKSFDSDSVVNGYKTLAIKSGVKEHAINALFDSKLTASLNAEIEKSNFPVILVAQANGHAIFNQVIVCEYLASRGYYVISTPSPTRINGRFMTYEELVSTAEDQAEDLKFSKNYILNKLNQPQDTKTGILAYSFGGRGALLYALRNNDLDAIVSWDSGLANLIGKEWIDYVKDFEPNDVKVPILHIYQPGDKSVQPDLEFFDKLNNPNNYSIEINNVNHGFFMIRGAGDAAFKDFQEQSYPDALAKQMKLFSETEKFFDANLENN